MATNMLRAGKASSVRPRRSLAVRAQQQTSTVSKRTKRKENEAGAFWVDHTCIDCDTCRWMEPSVYDRAGGQSAVVMQPEAGSSEEAAALRAINACPTGSIHFEDESVPKDEAVRKVKQGTAAFPFLFPQAEALGLEIYHLGNHSAESFGATSWLVRNPENGVVAMVDSPRYSSTLHKAIEERVGKVKYMFLTHSDDVADHAKWAEKMGVTRVIHESEAKPHLAITKKAGKGLDECEVQLSGEGPWDPFEGELGPNTKLILQQGHTQGSIVMHFQPPGAEHAVAFTGDHLARRRETGKLGCFTFVNRQPVEVQAAALRQWAADPSAVSVKLVLPGHGRWYATEDFVAALHTVADSLVG